MRLRLSDAIARKCLLRTQFGRPLIAVAPLLSCHANRPCSSLMRKPITTMPPALHSYLFQSPVPSSAAQSDIQIELPPLQGRNLEEHFLAIVEEQFGPYRNLLHSIQFDEKQLKALKKAMPKEGEWKFEVGWTRYANGKAEKVPYPTEDVFFFDVEICVTDSRMACMAVAASKDAWRKPREMSYMIMERKAKMSSPDDLFEGKEQVARIEDESEQAEQNRAHNSSEVSLIEEKGDVHAAVDANSESMPDSVKYLMLHKLSEEKFRFIWDHKYVHHSDRTRNAQLYEELKTDLEKEGHIVYSSTWLRKNFNSLRSQFNRLLDKIRRSRDPSYAETAKKWKFYYLMEVLQNEDSDNASTPTDGMQASISPQPVVVPFFNPQMPGPSNMSNVQHFNPNRVMMNRLVGQDDRPVMQRPKRKQPSPATDEDRSVPSKSCKSTAGHLSSTFVSICEALEEKRPGLSSELCLQMGELIQKGLRMLYENT
ncbi:hypothetical protein WR25_03927 isoform B [Diploscapter pachys]|uniref:Uncharacterized protein n=1 Tax=Diploscapter pachys TaxID=2018661 RepID=A0A2A2J1I5_9BILA|nr:hypothetical protein WR25_03927 isoform A [Diploscapter pachys]PAV55527.1 hypothetical protein WR25_03927 isoform B [Diploscapter pachys]